MSDKDKDKNRFEQELAILDEPKKFDYKGKEIKFWPLPTKSYFKFAKLVSGLRDRFSVDPNDPKKIDFDPWIILESAEPEVTELLAGALRVDPEKMLSQSAEFMVWCVRILLTEVIDADFFVQEFQKIRERVSPLFSRLLAESPEKKAGD